MFNYRERLFHELLSYHGQQRDDMIMSAMTQCRFDSKSCLEKFENEFRNQMIDTNYFSIYLQLQKHLKRELDNYREFCTSHMSYNPDDQYDPRNMIRACDKCGEIWIKVEGCDGSTICGQRVSEDSKIDSTDSLSTLRPQTPYYYSFEQDEVQIFQWSKEGWKVVKSKLSQAYQNIKGRLNSMFQTPPKIGIVETKQGNLKPKGCGKRIVWRDCPRIT